MKTTEHNGEQEYWGSHLVAARDIDQAKKMARRYFEKWYEDGDDKHAAFLMIQTGLNLLAVVSSWEIDGVSETTVEGWKERQVALHSIGKLPKAKSSCKNCNMLLRAACQHIRDCLDVGGEQSQQFADEITYLEKDP